MISARDLGYEGQLMIYTIGPLNEDGPARLSQALLDYISSPSGVSVRWKRTAISWRRISVDETRRLAAHAVTVVDADLSLADLYKYALARQLIDLPIHLYFSSGYVAFIFPHTLLDGNGAAMTVDKVMSHAGETPVDRTMVPVYPKRPLWAAAKKFGFTSVKGVKAARDMFREVNANAHVDYQFAETLTKAQSVERTHMAYVVIDAETVAGVSKTAEKTVPGQKASRPPIRIKLAAIVINAIKAVNPDGVDFRLVMALDARRYAERGVTIDNNFAPSVPLGRLMAGEWTAAGIMADFARNIKSGVAVAMLVAETLLKVKEAVQHPLRSRRVPASTPRVPLTVMVSLPGTVPNTPEDLWVPGATRVSTGGPGHRDFPIGIWIEVTGMPDDSVAVFIRDETGVLDIDRFEPELRAGLRAWVEAGATR